MTNIEEQTDIKQVSLVRVYIAMGLLVLLALGTLLAVFLSPGEPAFNRTDSGYVQLEDGREVFCISNAKPSGISCDWENAK